MSRLEKFCDGRLVKETDRINVGGASTNFHDHYVDGLHTWLLDGRPVTPTEADAFRSTWEAEQRG